jgi:hypothetical protein
MLFTQREHLLHYMLSGHVHLSKKDYGFFNNLQYIIKNNDRVTSNQNKLFDKLLVKYQRQLKKLGNDLPELQALQWKTNLVDSAEEFLSAQIHIVEKSIHIKSPFDTKFVQAFRNVPDNPYVWSKDEKKYIAPYSTYALKIAHESLNKYFTDIIYCNNTKSLLGYVKQFEGINWTPVLKKVNDRFYIGAINEYLNDAIKNIELNDDPKTLMLLSQYGIMISDEIIDNDSFKTFAGAYNVVSDLDMIDTLIGYLKLLDVEHVFTARDIIYNRLISDEIKARLSRAGMSCSPVNSSDNEGVMLKSTSSYGTPINNNRRIQKVVHLLNSRPVEIR